MSRAAIRRQRRAANANRTVWLGLLGCLLALSPRAVPADELQPLTLERLFNGPSLFGVAPSTPVWSPNSRHFVFTWNDQGLPRRGLWLAANDGSELRQLDTDPDEAASVREPVWLPDGKTVLTLRGNWLWSTSLVSGDNMALGRVGPGASALSVSPDGARAAYLQDGDLWFFDLEDGTTTAVTDVGLPPLSALGVGRYNRPDREIGPGIWGGPTYAWSPDGRYIAVHYVDRTAMRRVPFPDYLAAETDPNTIRRGYPGDANEARRVGVLDLADRSLKFLPLDAPTANQIVGFDWSRDGVLLVDVASDTAVDRWLYVVVPDAGEPREIWHGR
ncbi:MAG: DPP IV N-terminal domain-containing protein, partial [Pseudomonadota bacterium]